MFGGCRKVFLTSCQLTLLTPLYTSWSLDTHTLRKYSPKITPKEKNKGNCTEMLISVWVIMITFENNPTSYTSSSMENLNDSFMKSIWLVLVYGSVHEIMLNKTEHKDIYIYIDKHIHICTHKHIYMCVCIYVCACILNDFSLVQLFATLWTIACQIPLSMGIL